MRVGTGGLLRLQTLDIDSLGQAVPCTVDEGQGLERAQLLYVRRESTSPQKIPQQDGASVVF